MSYSTSPVFPHVNDFAIPRQPAPECEGHGMGTVNVAAIDRLQVDVRLGAVS